jgi:hypothetical protein
VELAKHGKNIWSKHISNMTTTLWVREDALINKRSKNFQGRQIINTNGPP